MKEFTKIKPNKKSLAGRRPVYGVGVNDSDYQVMILVEGKKLRCPIYTKWTAMLERCYSPKFQARFPAYTGCAVCNDWLTFSVFSLWMSKFDWKGMELDKDIIIQDNKIYSPSTCIFVTKEINNAVTKSENKIGKGATFNCCTGRFKAQCAIKGRVVSLGTYKSKSEASNAYFKFKAEHVVTLSLLQQEPLRGHLLRLSERLLSSVT